MTALDRALAAPKSLSAAEIETLLASDDEGLWRETFAAAREVKRRCGKTEVLPRGLIECSNVCAKDCLYCGIRKSNGKVSRYRLTESEAFACIDEARRRGYPAVAFQAGEIEGEANTAYYERLLAYSCGLEVTLSLGEQTEDVYRRWKAAGAMRYLIRIETSNRELYAKMHPKECSFDRRVACIRTLKRLGYVTGTGVMIGLPGQTLVDLARDIVFFGDENVDMVGMGPYVPHADTPMGKEWGSGILSASVTEGLSQALKRKGFRFPILHLKRKGFRFPILHPKRKGFRFPIELSLRMIALTRLYLHGINIVAASALEALDPENGRRRGIDAGANVVMPVLTPARHRTSYDLYPGKANPQLSTLNS